MAATVALVLFGMFALVIVAIIVLALYAKRETAKVAIAAVSQTFDRASKRILPLSKEDGKRADDAKMPVNNIP